MKQFVLKVLVFVFVLSATVDSYAQLRIWNLQSLEKAKSNPSEASKYLLRSADKELDKTIASVMDKKAIAPSGDKHDYMSLSRYWWPNPDTANGLPYIRKDGVSNPELNDYDRDELGDMTRSVTNLCVAFYLTSNDKYAQKAIENLRIWFINKDTKMNPNMNYGQTIPGRKNGEGRGEGVLDTYSFVEMLDGLDLLKTSKKFSVENQAAIKAWFSEYLNWMLTSEIGHEEQEAKNNHGTAFDVQAARYALFVGKDDIAKKIINEFPAKRLFTQIEPDGSQPMELARTTALGYSTFNLTHILDMCSIAKSIKIDLFNEKSSDGRSVSKALDFLTKYVGKSSKEFPYKQIKDWDEVQAKLCWQLYRADKFNAKPQYSKYYATIIGTDSKNKNLIFY